MTAFKTEVGSGSMMNMDAADVTDRFDECAEGCAGMMTGIDDVHVMDMAHECHRGCEKDMCHGMCDMMWEQCAGIEDQSLAEGCWNLF